MPDTRTLGSARSAISRDNPGTIATSGSITNRGGIAPRLTGSRGITNEPEAPAISPSAYRAIVAKISSATYQERGLANPFPQSTTITDANGNVSSIPKNPFETLADAFGKAFGGATYNPPLQQQSYGYGSTGGFSIGLLLIIGGIGLAVYYFYFRNK
jgi:hypothetical protein